MTKMAWIVALALLSPIAQALGAAQRRPAGSYSGQYDIHIAKGPLGMRFVWVPGGVFLSGTLLKGKSWHGEGIRRLNRPRLLTISGFWLSTTLVTNREFLAFIHSSDCHYKPDPSFALPKHYMLAKNDELVGGWQSQRFLEQFSNPALRKWRGNSLPVTCVSLGDAQAFCRWISRRERRHFYVPGIRQLQRAEALVYPRTSRKTRLEFLRIHDWIGANSHDHPHPVESKPADLLGLHDLLGNVFSWTSTAVPAYLDRATFMPFSPYFTFGADYAYVPGKSGPRWLNGIFTLAPWGSRRKTTGFRVAISGREAPAPEKIVGPTGKMAKAR